MGGRDVSGQSSPRAGWYPDPDRSDRERYWTGDGWGGQTGPKVTAGWFLDPDDQGLERFWDGVAWTRRTRPSERALAGHTVAARPLWGQPVEPRPAPSRPAQARAVPPVPPAPRRAPVVLVGCLVAALVVVLAAAGVSYTNAEASDREAEKLAQ